MTRDQRGALEQAVVLVAPHLNLEEVRALTSQITIQIVDEKQREATFDAAKALASLAQRVPWPERLNLLVSVLKYPTIYGNARDVLVRAAKEHPEAKAVKPPGDVWAVVEWLKTQRGIDLTTPPQRTRATR
jgi:hypothetical protein